MDSQFWNESYKEDPDKVIIEDRILDVEIEGLPIGKALDLGCGTGLNALTLAKRGWSVVGVDWAEHAIHLANQAAYDNDLSAEFVAGDITTWEPPEKYDLVVSMYSLPIGDDARLALLTACRALAPGGTLLVVEWDSSMTKIWGFGEGELLTPEQIADLLPGLEIEKADVLSLENLFSDDDLRGGIGSTVNVAFVRAKKRNEQ